MEMLIGQTFKSKSEIMAKIDEENRNLSTNYPNKNKRKKVSENLENFLKSCFVILDENRPKLI